MRKARCFALAVVAVCVFATSGTAAPPVEIYGADPAASDVRISPDGARVAMLAAEGGKSAMVIVDLANLKPRGMDVSNIKTRRLLWSGPNHVLLFASETANLYFYRSPKVEFGGVFSIDVRELSNPVQLLRNTKTLAAQGGLWDVRAVTGNDNGDVYMAAQIDHISNRIPNSTTVGVTGGTRDLLSVDGKTGRGNVIARGSETTYDWVVSPQGYVIARVDHAQKANRFQVMVPTDAERLGAMKVAFSEETDIPNIVVHGAASDEHALIVGARKGSDRDALFKMPIADGSLGDALFEHDLVDVTSVIEDPYSGAIVGADYLVDRWEQTFFENDLQAILGAVRKAMPGRSARITSWSKDRKKFVVFSEGAGDAGVYVVLDLATGKFINIGASRPKLDAADIGKVMSFSYPARDGLQIHAFLTVPPGREARNLPLVVMPHGGPAARDSASFDWWAQFMASRGYAVLQMNFRGSSGYGDAFETAGEGEWGGKMQDDVTDGVKHVINQGIADPERICIVGGSYGGYAALAGAALTPDLYKCAVSVAGVSDLERKMAWAKNRYGSDSWVYGYWIKSVGDPEVDRDKIRSRSPAKIADKIAADVLLIHGKDDTVVPIEQSEIMAAALKAAGKPVSFVTLDGEDHWLSTEKTRIDMLRELERFLAKHLGA